MQTVSSLIRKRHLEKDVALHKDAIIDIIVSYDGSWMKRGHCSLYGLGALIDIDSGLVLDYQVMSLYCHVSNI